ncbi:DUF2254 domain-containing protein [Salinispora arenicola]|uniref:DUF2254 domain-containing protein n=1 Tax=Salinispora arenicola TaxID=168697 RepID=UPI0016A078B5|nr:DUF2254 domain-containing protein [Salinispora arenicola]NIL58230.1 DUF2254 domain-containing protein [Salinispora arenicola]NIL63839.1 DUF2254 domain-containing protein [Salinispora arenicola]
MMLWARFFRIRQNLVGSLWFFPLLGLIAGGLFALLVRAVDAVVTLPSAWHVEPSSAEELLTIVVEVAGVLAGFVVAVSVVVLELHADSFPRYLRLLYRDRFHLSVVTVLLGTVAFAFTLLVIGGTSEIPQLGVGISGILLIVSFALFVVFLNHLVHQLRPVAVAAEVTKTAQKLILSREQSGASMAPEEEPTEESTLVIRARRSGSVQAVSEAALVRWASQRDCHLRSKVAAGDYVIAGQPVMEIYGKRPSSDSIEQIHAMVAMGIERTIERDPAFPFRILVDSAARALSSAINDPTTAVQMLDYIEELLRTIAAKPLGAMAYADESGQSRLVMPGRTWEDYLTLAVTEIREYGASSIQVMRRLRAMLEDLREVIPDDRRPAVEAELSRLDQTLAASFGGQVDHDRATVPDRQGIGGPGRG